MKIVTWNVNGLRTLDLGKTLSMLDADVVCLQETKLSREKLDGDCAIIDDYSAYFSCCRSKPGYSGVATFCPQSTSTPEAAEEGLSGLWTSSSSQDAVGYHGDYQVDLQLEDLQSLDSEGRAIVTLHLLKDGGKCAIVNVYCPRNDPDRPDRLAFKLNFLHLLGQRVRALLTGGVRVVVVGDLNVSHKQQDHCDPEPEPEFSDNPGRQWLTSLLTKSANEDLLEASFVDLFRYFHPDQKNAYTCWNTKLNARATNYGTRIDYILVDQSFVSLLPNDKSCYCEILADMFGSDHCPVVANLPCQFLPSVQEPSLCAKFLPQFRGTQTKLSSFLPTLDETEALPAKVKAAVPLKRKTDLTLRGFFDSKSKRKCDNDKDSKAEQERCDSNDLINESADSASGVKRSKNADWTKLFTGPPPAPMCVGHQEPSVLRTVKKSGPNQNKRFYVCARPEGRKDDPLARCDFFMWQSARK